MAEADQASDAPEKGKHTVQLFLEDFAQPCLIQMSKDATVGSITVAEEKLGTLTQPIHVCSCIGTALKLSEPITPYQQIFLRETHSAEAGISGMLPPLLQSTVPTTRAQVLFNQQAWVAVDEMDFYLGMLNSTGALKAVGPCAMPQHTEDDELENMMQQWFSELLPTTDHQGPAISALLVDQHWFPVIVTPQVGKVLISTTLGGQGWVEFAVRSQGVEYTIQPVQHSFVTHFNNDCGFKVVAWLTEALFTPDFGEPLHRVKPIDTTTAIAWRAMFEFHLHNNSLIDHVVIPADMHFGGTTNGDVTKKFEDLLIDRGVPATVAPDRAAAIMDKLGRLQIAKAIRGSAAWKEIKQLANLASPKVQLVLPSEMQEAVQNRISNGKPFGDKKKKIQSEKKPKKAVQVKPEDISIQEGIFRDAHNGNIGQLQFCNMGPEARGVVVVQAEQAIPYLRFAQPFSKHALAMIVVDHQNPIVNGAGEEIRFPARCERTAEPIILSARMIQLGAVEVCRVAPTNATQVDEVCSVVLRTCTYRDELQPGVWDKFVARPIKCIVDDLQLLQPDSQGRSPIMDVWDRQWLTEKYQRTRPQEAALFCVCFRVELTDLCGALQKHGKIATT